MEGPQKIIEMASAFYSSCVLFTASDAGVFGFLAEKGPAGAAAFAQEKNYDERAARLLLDACVALDLLKKDGDLYSNTEESGFFLVPGSIADLSRAIRYNRDVYPAWGRMMDLVKTGKPVEEPEEHLGGDAERTRTFVMSMHGRAMGIGMAVAPMLELAGRKKLLDVGGGPGTYSVLAAGSNPELSCTVMDLPAVVEVAAELIAQQNMSERVKTLAGDYHDTEFPAGNDAVLLFGMLHQESPESIMEILKKAYAALNPGGVVYIMDMMTDATHTKPAFSALFAVNMALTTDNGWVFSSDELQGWTDQAGFTGFEIKPLPPPMPHWLARANKPA